MKIQNKEIDFKFKRLLTIGIAVVLMFCISLIFVGCKDEETVIGPIPDGKYMLDSGAYIYVEDCNCDYYLEIEGNDARIYGAGWLDDQAKIIEKNGRIYFECYQWNYFLFDLVELLNGRKPEKFGSTAIYLVEYNAEKKSLTLKEVEVY